MYLKTMIQAAPSCLINID